MNAIKKSTISLDRVELRSVKFESRSNKLHRADIPLSAIQIDLHSSKEETLLPSLSTLCRITIFSPENPKADFYAELLYRIEASVENSEDVDLLTKFSTVGAAFNAFVFARQAIADLTFKAFGKAVRLPLLNIGELGARISSGPLPPSLNVESVKPSAAESDTHHE
jgi:hypothetical protein